MPRSTTATVPRESHHFDSSVLASVSLTTSPTALMLITLLTASGLCVPPVAYMVLCVRFASIVHVCSSRNHLQRSAGDATLDTGGWLDLMETILCLPVRDLHPERNVKLRLPHQWSFHCKELQRSHAPGKPCNPARSVLTIRVNAKYMIKPFRTSMLHILANGQQRNLG